GSIIACNPYPTFFNQMDQWIDWPMKWSENKNKPLVLEETSVPFAQGNFAAWYLESENRRASYSEYKQLFAEQSARYLGDQAYGMIAENPLISFNSFSDNLIKEGEVTWRVLNTAGETVTSLWMERCLRGWRMYDVSGIWPFERTLYYFAGGIKTENFSYKSLGSPGKKPDVAEIPVFSRKTKLYQSVCSFLKPFMAYIGGRKERFSSLEHNYTAGEKIEKQMLFSNDRLSAVKYNAVWKIIRENDGSVTGSGKWNGELAPGNISMVPFQWTAPTVQEREYYKILFETEDSAGAFCRDEFMLTIFPNQEIPKVSQTILLYDESGFTSRLFKDLNISSESFSSALQIGNHSCLVVGRESFSKTFLDLAEKTSLGKALQNGFSMIIFEQTDKQALAPYLEERRERYVFIKNASHPLLKDLGSNDLHHWRGKSDLVPAYPLSTYCKPNRFLPWGNEGCVSSFVMDKPASGNFNIILDCDADLSRTPLVEYFFGLGRILFCQLDVTAGYRRDPVIARLINNLLSYTLNSRPRYFIPAGYVGGKRGNVLMEKLGVSIRKIEKESDLDGIHTIIVGEAPYPISAKTIRESVRDGIMALSLPKNSEELSEFDIPVKLKPGKTKITRISYQESPVIAECTGLGNSDFYFNTPVELNIFETGSDKTVQNLDAVLRKISIGKGGFIFLQISPEYFYGRYGEDKACRIISVLLTSLGVEIKTSGMFGRNILEQINLTGKEAFFSIDPYGKGNENSWEKNTFHDNQWEKIKISSSWEKQDITNENLCYKSESQPTPYDGDAWYRIHVNISHSYHDKELFLVMGTVDDFDWTYFNGVQIGHTGEETKNYWCAARKYKLPKELIRYNNDNVIAIRVKDLGGDGGITADAVITWEGAKAELFYPRPSRFLFDFDPNRWRQW
ncbi:MAG TPA: hypothetical protein DC049_12720, partial [Spirochaetia bacterium]|nr:hypothetical protein [Spirochaetia bacterium]